MTTTTKPLRPFFTFYGGKWRIAPKYPTPAHAVIVEPFAGAAGYAMRHPDHAVILVEKDPRIFATWDYLTRATPDEVAALPLYDGSWETTDDLTHLPDGARWLIGWWLNKGGATPAKSPSAWMRAGTGSPGDFWGPVIRDRVASQVERVRHWKVIHGSYEQAPDMAATWFIDPPYQAAGRHYKHGAAALDFSALGEWCRSRPGQVMVCENEGADWLPFRHHLDAKANESRHGGKVSREVIWVNE